MTPKEKANELVGRFIRFHRNGIYNVVHEDIAKQFALIAVDEIIKAIPDASDDNSPYNHELKYWQEVKQEIENL
jgi:hypothetical protein